MPSLNKLLVNEGTTYQRHFCTVALCCPSRVSLLTGKAAHNTNVTDVSPPYGGYTKFISQGLNDDYLPIWLQAAGYNTYYVGKLMNNYATNNYDKPFPNGFNNSNLLLDPFTYNYLNSTWTNNKASPQQYPGNHTTDITTKNALALLDEAVKADEPFFLTVAPIAPHSDIVPPAWGPPIPQDKYKDAFPDAKVPRTPDFNPDVPSGAQWIKELPQQNQSNIDYNDGHYRARLQTVAGVDDMISELITAVESHGILNSTYIVFTTDNGFHIGQHRMQPGKSCGYETDINIPLIIRGPGVPVGETTDIVTTHTDLAPTFFSMLGIPARPDFDGEAIPLTAKGISAATGKRSENVNVEYWGLADSSEGIYGEPFTGNNTYKAVRLYGNGWNLYYSVWCTNEHELYVSHLSQLTAARI